MTNKPFRIFWPDDNTFLKEWNALPLQDKVKARRVIQRKAAQGHNARHTRIKRAPEYFYLKLPGQKYRVIYEKDDAREALYIRAIVHRDKAYGVRVPHLKRKT